MQDGQQLETKPQVLQTAESEKLTTITNRRPMWLWGGIAASMLMIIVGIGAFVFHKAAPVATNSKQSFVKPQQVDTNQLSAVAGEFSVSTDTVIINGQLQANQNLVLTPTNQPQTPVSGLIYLDKTSGELKYYNGTTFLSLADKNALAQLQNQQQALVSGVVTSLQSATGDVNLTGTGGLSVTASGTTISLKLPQNLTTTSNPTFAGLTLGSPLAISSGGTGQTSFAASGVLITDSGGVLQSLTDTNVGECFVSGVGPGGAPGFAGCNGSTPVTQLNGLNGALVIANANGSGSTITINDASTSAKGIAQFDSTNFSASSGVINTVQNIDTGATPIFAGLTLSSPLAVTSGGTGANNSAQALINLGAASSGANSDIVSTTALDTIVPDNDLLIGATSHKFTLQGDTSSTLKVVGGDGFNTTVGFNGVATADVSYQFDRTAASGTWVICTTAGNCNGAGGVTTAGGTSSPATFAIFTGSQAIGNSILTQVGSSIRVAQSGGTAGAIGFQNTSNGNIIKLQSGATAGGDVTLTLPTSGGSSGQCLTTSGGSNAALSFATCLSGAGGGGGGVVSLDGLSGTLVLDNSTGSGSNITIDNAQADGATRGIAAFDSNDFTDNGNTGLISTIQGINTADSPQFAGLTLTGDLTLGTSGTIFANNLTHTANGQDITLDSGNDGITFQTNGGDSFVFPTGGGAGQTICTTGVTCVAGGGLAVILGPSSVQTDASANASIFFNDTGGGNLLQLRSSGTDKFVVSNSGATSLSSISSLNPVTDNLTFNANNISYNLPTTGSATQTICTDAGNCTGGGGPQAVLLAPGSAQANASATASSIFINNTSTAKLLQLQGSGADKFTVASNGDTTVAGTFSGTTITGTGNINSSGGAIQTNSTTRITNGGNLTNIGSITASSTYNTNTFTGSALQFGTAGTATIQSAASQALNITGHAASIISTDAGSLTLGSLSQQFDLLGNSTSTIVGKNGAFTTTVGFSTPTANVNYNFNTAAAGTYNICTTAGNCVGSGGGVTTSGGTTGTIALFTGSQAIGDSVLSQSGATITIANSGASPGALSLKNGTNSNTFTLQSGVSSSNLVFTLPTADGTNGQCITTNGSGTLSFGTCTSGGGVTLLNGLSGSVTLANANPPVGQTITIQNTSTGQKGLVQISNNGNLSVTSGVLDTIQGISMSATPIFAGLTLSSPLGLASGGTGCSNSASCVRANINAAVLGANTDITSTTLLNSITAASAITLGTTNANGINFQTNSTTVLSLSATGVTLLQPTAGSTTAFQVRNTGSNQVLSVDTTGNQVVLGKAGTLSGQLAFASATGGVITLTPASTASNFTLTLPAETGTVCTNSVSSVCTSANNGSYLFKNAVDTSTLNSGSSLYTFNNNAGPALTLNGRLIVNSSTGTNIGVSATGNNIQGNSLNMVAGSTSSSTGTKADGGSALVSGGTGSNFLGSSGTQTGGAVTIQGGTVNDTSGAVLPGFYSPSAGASLTLGGGNYYGGTGGLDDTANGGTLALSGGNGGTPLLGCVFFGCTTLGGNGGNAVIQGGAANDGTNGTGYSGGELQLLGGTSTTGLGGDVVIQGGTSGLTGGNIILSGGGGPTLGSVIVRPVTNGANTFQVQGSGGSSFLSVDTTTGATKVTLSALTNLIKPVTDSTTTFQVQNTAGVGFLTADSTDQWVSVVSTAFGSIGGTLAVTNPNTYASRTGGQFDGQTNADGTNGTPGTMPHTYFYRVTTLFNSNTNESLPSSEVSTNAVSIVPSPTTSPAATTTPAAGAGFAAGTYNVCISYSVDQATMSGGNLTKANFDTVPSGTTGGTPVTLSGGNLRIKVDWTALTIPNGANYVNVWLGDTTPPATHSCAGSVAVVGIPAGSAANGPVGTPVGTGFVTISGATAQTTRMNPSTAYTNTNVVKLTWTAVSGASGYRIYRSSDIAGCSNCNGAVGSGAEGRLAIVGATTSYTDTTNPNSAPGTGVSGAVSAGRLGIGTTTPGASLNVVGTALFTPQADNNSQFQIQNAAGANIFNVDTTATTGSVTVKNAAGTTLFNIDTVASAVSIQTNLTVTGTYNTNTFTSTGLQFGGASTAIVQSAAGRNLTVQSPTGGTLSLGAGVSTNVNTNVASGGVINIGSATNADSINIGTGAAAQTITIGNTTSTTSLTLRTGTGSATLSGAAPGLVLGNGTNANAALTVTGAAGGATSGTSGQQGGNGSAISVTSGTGGAATGGGGINIGGTGGALTLQAGSGGNATSGVGGAGGNVSISAGGGGSGNLGTGASGNVIIQASGGLVGIGTNTPGNLLSIGALSTVVGGQVAVSTGSAANKGIIIQGVASQTGDLLQAQSSAGTVLAKIDANGNLTAKAATFTGTLSVNGHIISGNTTGSTTVAAVTAQCGTGCTATISGNDTAGVITLNTGTGVAAGTLATVTFAGAYGSAPTVILTPKDVPAASTYPQYYYGSNTTTFDLKAYTALTDSKTYTFSYQIIQ